MASGLALSMAACSHAQPEAEAEVEVADYEVDKARIWKLEQAIYSRRAEGDLQYYLDLSNDAYVGWPFGMEKPASLEQLTAFASQANFQPGEIITLESDAISVDGDTAISYFSTHRTQVSGGEAVDQRYENIHVWARNAGEWTLIGSFSRQTQ